MSAKILLLEDEDVIRDVLKEYLLVAGYEVQDTPDGDEAVRFFDEGEFDLAVLDIMVPGTDGYGVLDHIRSCGSKCGVIMLTALGDEASQLRAFNSLADDYVVKPVSPLLLLKRIETILRRIKTAETGEDGAMGIGLYINENSYTAYFDGEVLPLTLSEYLLLLTLYGSPGTVFTREQLILRIFNEDYVGNDRIIDAHVKNLRKKLPVNCIRTVVGIGYSYSPD